MSKQLKSKLWNHDDIPNIILDVELEGRACCWVFGYEPSFEEVAAKYTELSKQLMEVGDEQ